MAFIIGKEIRYYTALFLYLTIFNKSDYLSILSIQSILIYYYILFQLIPLSPV